MVSMKKKIESKNPFKSLGVGYAHYLRNGAGAHKDRKKESNKKQCRDKIKASDWNSSFLYFRAGKNRFCMLPGIQPPTTLSCLKYCAHQYQRLIKA